MSRALAAEAGLEASSRPASGGHELGLEVAPMRRLLDGPQAYFLEAGGDRLEVATDEAAVRRKAVGRNEQIFFWVREVVVVVGRGWPRRPDVRETVLLPP